MRQVAIILLLIVSCSCAGRGWTRFDTALEATALATSSVDYVQTRGITARCVEENPLIGRCGDGPVPAEAYFAATVAGRGVIARRLSPHWRRAFLVTVIGVETFGTYRNFVYRDVTAVSRR